MTVHSNVCVSTRFFYLIFFCSILLALPSCWSSKSIVSAPKKNAAELRLRKDISGYAENFIGTNYRTAGISPNSGFDCSGFTSYVMDEFDINLERTSTGQSKMGKSVKQSKAQPGDLVYFAKRGRVFHVALVVANTDDGIEVVHSTSSRGVVRENISQSDYWKPKIKGVRNILSK